MVPAASSTASISGRCPSRRRVEDLRHLGAHSGRARRGQAERLVELHSADERCRARGEAHEDGLRQEADEVGPPAEGEEQPDGAGQQGEGGHHREVLGANEAVLAEVGSEGAQDEQPGGGRGPGHDLPAPAQESREDARHRRRRQPVDRRDAREHGEGDGLGERQQGHRQAGGKVEREVLPEEEHRRATGRARRPSWSAPTTRGRGASGVCCGALRSRAESSGFVPLGGRPGARLALVRGPPLSCGPVPRA